MALENFVRKSAFARQFSILDSTVCEACYTAFVNVKTKDQKKNYERPKFLRGKGSLIFVSNTIITNRYVF